MKQKFPYFAFRKKQQYDLQMIVLEEIRSYP